MVEVLKLPTHAAKFATLSLALSVVALPGLAFAHTFSENAVHDCKGKAAWDNRNGVSQQSIGFTLPGSDDKMYVSAYFEVLSSAQGTTAGTSIWLESNGADWLQKEDYVCRSPQASDAGYVSHSDTRLL